MIKYIENIESIDKLESTNYRPINEDQVTALVASIREIGLQEPIKIFELEGTKQRYIISGHHRAEAIRQLRESNARIVYALPAELKRGTKEELESQTIVVSSIVANMFRSDMTVLERAAAYKKLADSGLSVQEIARQLTVDRKTVTNGLAVAALPQDAKDWVKANKVTDARVYQVATAYKRDPSIDCIERLSKAPAKKAKTKKLITIDPDLLAEKLRKAKVGEATIKKVVSVI
ncbi:ParB/RepB/Spo0J family partition protein [Pseudobacteriovorax antillogorgiicola]|uniref:ParB/RepB/Spo0J family partition protein n=1 Tax=Pseudobacteriovorax antillogorgiicola TaxID=1513793 RepID=A0A1Y6BXC8_9BACT|nr:ParB N-terminal domain-containing protein [Pseudobacteriovorax antillogorgiicola]TCS53715.1 ParB/RepB/Spo0J family partition protein [Pseudobacteriovorax antillogorgiicola]SMF22896.1 ParB/RepB/Spo0J family partition protein [Pseudobacteriovorax antillogorgiicola]